MNVGIIYMSGWVEGLDFLFDYIDIELINVIVFFMLIDIMNVCYDVIDYFNCFCDQFECEVDGQLFVFNVFIFGYVNVVFCNFKVVEYIVNYKNDLMDYLFIGDYFDGDDGLLLFCFSFFKFIQDEILNMGFDFIDDYGEFDNLDFIVNG